MSLSKLTASIPGGSRFAGPLTASQRGSTRESLETYSATVPRRRSVAEAFAQGCDLPRLDRAARDASVGTSLSGRDAAAVWQRRRTLAERGPGGSSWSGREPRHCQDARPPDYDKATDGHARVSRPMGSAPWPWPGAEVPPIILAALGPKMVGLAGERTAGIVRGTLDRCPHQRGQGDFLSAGCLSGRGTCPSSAHADLAASRAIATATSTSISGRPTTAITCCDRLVRVGSREARSDALFDAIVAWGDIDRIAGQVRERFEPGGQVVLTSVGTDASVPPFDELRLLAPLSNPILESDVDLPAVRRENSQMIVAPSNVRLVRPKRICRERETAPRPGVAGSPSDPIERDVGGRGRPRLRFELRCRAAELRDYRPGRAPFAPTRTRPRHRHSRWSQASSEARRSGPGPAAEPPSYEAYADRLSRGCRGSPPGGRAAARQ